MLKFLSICLLAFALMLPDAWARHDQVVPVGMVSGLAAAVPEITVSKAAGYITACQGTVSANPAIQQFTVSGSSLAGNVTATAPVNFEISLNAGAGYGNSITLAAPGGILAGTIIYTRSSVAAPAGNISGNVILSSPGATAVSAAVAGTINLVPNALPMPSSQEVTTGQPTAPVGFTGPGDVFTWVNDTPSIGLASSGSGDIPSFTAVNGGSTPLTATITVTPQQISYAYIGNQADNTISIINTANNTVIKTLTAINATPTGFDISPDGKKVYLTNEYVNQGVSVISTVTNTEPNGIASRINAAPVGIGVSPDGSKIYVADAGLHQVYVLDVAHSYTTLPGYAIAGNPVWVTVSPDGSNLYVTNSTAGMSAINTVTGAVSAINVTGNTYQSCLSRDGSLLYVTMPDNNMVAVYDIAANAVTATISVGTKPEGINISPDGSKLYVTNNGSARVSVISTLINQVAATIPVGLSPYGVCSTSDGQFVYVTNQKSNSVSVINTTTNTVSATIPVGNTPTSLGNFILPGGACPGQPSTVTIKVDPKPLPVITAGNVTGIIVACAGSMSTSPYIGQLTVSAQNLTGPVTVTAPANFEVSLSSASGYAKSTPVQESGGTISNVLVYIRPLAGLPAGNIAGNILLVSTGAADQNVPVSGLINALPTVDKVAGQTITNGQMSAAVNFTGTALLYSWTNDRPAIGLPAGGTGNIAAFTAIDNSNIPVTATITVTPQPSGNYLSCDGVPITFSITVQPTSVTTSTQAIVIPNTFTPNGDGINDTWTIKAIENYPNCTVNIYNRYGEKIYSSIGYPIPWNGKFKGNALPAGTYYYIINLESNSPLLSGHLAIIK